MISRRWVLFAAALLAGSIPLPAQIPGMWNWWDRPIAQDLNLSEEQKKQLTTEELNFDAHFVILVRSADLEQA